MSEILDEKLRMPRAGRASGAAGSQVDLPPEPNHASSPQWAAGERAGLTRLNEPYEGQSRVKGIGKCRLGDTTAMPWPSPPLIPLAHVTKGLDCRRRTATVTPARDEAPTLTFLPLADDNGIPVYAAVHPAPDSGAAGRGGRRWTRGIPPGNASSSRPAGW